MKTIFFIFACFSIPFFLKNLIKNLFALLFATSLVVVIANVIIFYPNKAISGNLIARSLGESVIPIVIGFFAYLLVTHKKVSEQNSAKKQRSISNNNKMSWAIKGKIIGISIPIISLMLIFWNAQASIFLFLIWLILIYFIVLIPGVKKIAPKQSKKKILKLNPINKTIKILFLREPRKNNIMQMYWA